jgi:GR25 family glycosyltransferase involved in LPS biosynthesis
VYLVSVDEKHRVAQSISDVFPHIVCINLDRRPDRWQRLQKRAGSLNIGGVQRFSAIDGATLDCPADWDDYPGAYGCLLSHIAVVRRAREQRLPNILILEDDAVFDAQIESRFASYISQVPADWDMLLFGGIHGGSPVAVTANIIKIDHTLSTFAYALKHTIYDRFIELNERALTVVDESNRILQKEFNCYCFMPHLAWVEEDYSDIRGETENLWWIKESITLWGPEMDQLLRRTGLIIAHRGKSPRDARIMDFVAGYYSERLPQIDILIVEQGERRRLERERLPARCAYRFQLNFGPTSRARAFTEGYEHFKDSKDVFVFMDSNLLLTREDLRANLRKCLEYEVVTSYDRVADLSGEDAESVMTNDIRWDAPSTRDLKRRRSICDSCCIITLEGMRIVEALSHGDGWSEEAIGAAARRSLRVFESPNRARRLL